MFQFNVFKSPKNEAKLLVVGYIREFGDELKSSRNSALFQNIPDLITSICVLYYYIDEYFALINEQHTKISNNNTTINKVGYSNWNHSSYGKVIIPSTNDHVYKWYIKINRTNQGQICMGISSSASIRESYYYSSDSYNYSIWGRQGKKRSHLMEVPYWNKYSKRFITNDIVVITLDLNEKEMSFDINEEKFGVAFTGIECGKNIDYRFAVTLFETFSSVSIIKFTESAG